MSTLGSTLSGSHFAWRGKAAPRLLIHGSFREWVWPQEVGGEVHSVSDLISPFAPFTLLEMLFGGVEGGESCFKIQRNYIGKQRI